MISLQNPGWLMMSSGIIDYDTYPILYYILYVCLCLLLFFSESNRGIPFLTNQISENSGRIWARGAA